MQAATSAREHHDNLPTPATPLVGRGQQRALVRERLLQPDVRLLTLTGTGGTGKTRLALAVAADVLDAFAEGVWFVNLAPIEEASLVLPAIVHTLGIKEQPGASPQSTLAAFLRGRRLLLVLDNFEQVADAAAEVGGLLDGAPDLKILVTSRMALRLYGEYQVQVPPLELPERGQPPSLDALASYEAVALFLQRAQAAHASFRPTAADAPAIVDICAQLDGLPLAIELAAARIRLLPPHALLARLNRRFALLTGGAQNVPARHQTLRSTVDWSYNLLESAEQTVFRRLAVFAGGCSLEAAEAICGQPSEALDHLASLVDKSLLERRDGPDGEPRFAMLETIREYAVERLEHSGEAAQLRHAHARWFMALAERAQPELAGGRRSSWLPRLEADHDNLRAALASAFDHGDDETGMRLAGAMWRFWLARGYISEGQHWLDRALAVESQEATNWRTLVLNASGILARQRGDIQQAEAMHEQALLIARQLDVPRLIAHPLLNLGNVAHDRADYALAVRLYEESLALYRQVGDQIAIGMTMNNLANSLREQGHIDAALALREESLALHRSLGDDFGAALALGNMGRDVLHGGDRVRARRLLSESLLLTRELGDFTQVPLNLDSLAAIAASDGDLARSAQLWGAADALRAQLGTRVPLNRVQARTAAIDSARARLGAPAFEAAWAKGSAMSVLELLAYGQEAGASESDASEPLSPREREVAALIAAGLTSREIADRLVITERTADTHADHIRTKLGLRSRAEIAAWATERGLRPTPRR